MLDDKRQAIRHLLDENKPADAAAYYYAFNHSEYKTRLHIYPDGSLRASSYICLAQTGIDLFRPLVTLRLPESTSAAGIDFEASLELIYGAIPEGMGVILNGPTEYSPLLNSLFEIQKEEQLKLLVLDRGRFQPIINVLVTESDSYNGLPRYIVRKSVDDQSANKGDILASAGLNWQSSRFAEVFVHTKAANRRLGLGRSVAAAMVQHVLDSGRRPVYAANAENYASIQLAESIGFVDMGISKLLIEATLKPRKISSFD
jgi:hypothetical protein